MPNVLIILFLTQLKIEMISVHKNDDGSAENILGLSDDELAIRKVDMVDIALDKVCIFLSLDVQVIGCFFLSQEAKQSSSISL